MRRLARIAFLFAAPATAFAGDTIPPQYRGVWNTSQTRCGAAESVGRVVISAKEFTTYYNGGPVKSVTIFGDRHASMVATLSTIVHTNIDITSDVRYELVLSESKNELTLVPENGESFTRQRCAKSEPALR